MEDKLLALDWTLTTRSPAGELKLEETPDTDERLGSSLVRRQQTAQPWRPRRSQATEDPSGRLKSCSEGRAE